MNNYCFIYGIILIIVFSYLCTACEDYVTGFEIGEKQKKIVLNGLVAPDTLIVHLMLSMHIDDKINIYNINSLEKTGIIIDDAIVTLYEDGRRIGDMEYIILKNDMLETKLGYYTIPGFTPKAGAVYKVEASARNLPPVSAEATIPIITETIEIDAIIRRYTEGFAYDYPLEITSTITNNGRKGYYGFSSALQLYNMEYEWICDDWGWNCRNIPKDTIGTFLYWISMTTPPGRIDFYDNGFYVIPDEGDNSPRCNTFFASDKGTSAEPFKIKFSIANDNLKNNIGDTLIFNIDIYEHAAYTHLFSLARKNSMDEDDFIAEKISVYSNVRNGLGLFGARNTYRYKLQIQPFNKDQIYQ